MLTQVLVGGGDPGFKKTTTPIGEFHTKKRAAVPQKKNQDRMLREDGGRGYALGICAAAQRAAALLRRARPWLFSQ